MSLKKLPFGVKRKTAEAGGGGGEGVPDKKVDDSQSGADKKVPRATNQEASQSVSVSIVSWNIDGWNAEKVGVHLTRLLREHKPDVMCLQETKMKEPALRASLESICKPEGYGQIWINAHNPSGWHGVAVLVKDPTERSLTFRRVEVKLNCAARDDNTSGDPALGRVIALDCVELPLRIVMAYVPNSGRDLKHLDYRVQQWNPAMAAYLQECHKQKPTVYIGDFNVAGTPLDISDPKRMSRWAGCTKAEQESHAAFLKDHKWVDIWRVQHPDERSYSWRGKSGSANPSYGLRLDAALVSPDLVSSITHSWIKVGHAGPSDHVPIGVTVRLARPEQKIKRDDDEEPQDDDNVSGEPQDDDVSGEPQDDDVSGEPQAKKAKLAFSTSHDS